VRHVLLVTPYSLESNPYVRLLIEALEGAGERVELARGKSPVLLLRSLRRHGVPRIVHLQWHHPYLTAERLPVAIARAVLFFLQCALLRLLGARLVWTVHNLVEHERRHEAWEHAAGRLLARMATPIAHCPAAAGEVAAAFGVPVERVRVVPHGILELGGSPDRGAERRARGIGEDQVLLLNFGRIRRYKGIEELLEAFRATDDDRLRLSIAGFPDDPGLAADLRRETEGDARIDLCLEQVGDEELGRLLAACDAVVLPYRDSLTSGAAVLAAGHGRGVIAPRLGCLRDLPEGAGLFYDPGAADGLGRALAAAAEAPLPAMGAAARAHAEASPWSLVARRTVSIYDAISPPARSAASSDD